MVNNGIFNILKSHYKPPWKIPIEHPIKKSPSRYHDHSLTPEVGLLISEGFAFPFTQPGRQPAFWKGDGDPTEGCCSGSLGKMMEQWWEVLGYLLGYVTNNINNYDFWVRNGVSRYPSMVWFCWYLRQSGEIGDGHWSSVKTWHPFTLGQSIRWEKTHESIFGWQVTVRLVVVAATWPGSHGQTWCQLVSVFHTNASKWVLLLSHRFLAKVRTLVLLWISDWKMLHFGWFWMISGWDQCNQMASRSHRLRLAFWPRLSTHPWLLSPPWPHWPWVVHGSFPIVASVSSHLCISPIKRTIPPPERISNTVVTKQTVI